MPRIMWFALGAVAGAAYASRVIDKQRLDLPPSLAETQALTPKTETPKESPKLKAARLIQQQTERLAMLVIDRGELLGTRIADRGRELADRVRGETASPTTLRNLAWLPENEPETPAPPIGVHHTPRVTPEMGYTPGLQQIDQDYDPGLELNRQP